MNPTKLNRESSYDRDMIAVGLDINLGGLSRQKLSAKRIKKGECPSCGIKLFKVGIMVKKKVPLSIIGRVQEGRCLACRPLDTPQKHSNEFWARNIQPNPLSVPGLPQEIPTQLVRGDSVMSGITMDQNFTVLQTEETSYVSSVGSRSAGVPKPPRLRPGASFGDEEQDERPAMPLRGPSGTRNTVDTQDIPLPPPLATEKPSYKPKAVPVYEQKPKATLKAPPQAPQDRVVYSSSNEETKTEIRAPSWNDSEDDQAHKVMANNSNNLCDLVGLETVASTSSPREIFFDSSQMCDLVGLEEQENEHIASGGASMVDSASNQQEILVQPQPDDSRYKEIHVDPQSLPPDDEDMKPAAQPRRARRDVPLSVADMDIELRKGPASKQRQEPKQRTWSQRHYIETTTLEPEPKSEPIIDTVVVSREAEVPSLVQRVGMNGVDWDTLSSAIRELIVILWTSGAPAKQAFVDSQGVKAIIKLVWADISDSSVQELVVQLFLALVASVDGDSANDVLMGERLDDMIDALMIVMQVLIENEAIQEYGCRILSCLATASFSNPDINDGTLSGAVQTVVNAVAAHRTSQSIQECGLQALFYQCTYSQSCDSNKLTLVQGDQSGAPSPILLALRNEAFESSVAEWACKLFWSLSQDVVAMIPSGPDVLEEMLLLLRGLHKDADYVELLTAASGTIANLIKVEGNQQTLDMADTILLSVDLMRYQNKDVGIVIECCCLIGNLAVLSTDMDAVAETGGIQLIVDSMRRFPDVEPLYEEAVRALACVSIRLNAAKEALCEPGLLSTVIQLCRRHETSVEGSEMVCTLLASIFASDTSTPTVLIVEAVDAVCSAMRSHPEALKVQEAGSFALRNLSHRDDSVSLLVQNDALTPALAAMTRFEHAKSIQLNGCCILWNFGSNGGRNEAAFDDLKGIHCIVKVIQNHLESTEVLEMACGALWSLIRNSDLRKRTVVAAGGVDAVGCSFVMHPGTPSLLEAAGGVFSSLSASASLSEAIMTAQGVSTVVDMMRDNGSSASVLRIGALFLRNMVVLSSDCSAEAEGAITAIINGMKTITEESFQVEACNFLWALSALSNDGKSKILALDGILVLMNTLEQYNDSPGVQEAALGAFNQLALTSSG